MHKKYWIKLSLEIMFLILYFIVVYTKFTVIMNLRTLSIPILIFLSIVGLLDYVLIAKDLKTLEKFPGQYRFYFLRILYILYMLIVIVGYIVNWRMLKYISIAFIYSIALEIFICAKNKKYEPFYTFIDIIPFYIISFGILALGVVINIELLIFNNVSNMIVSLIAIGYLYYINERDMKNALKRKTFKQDFIGKYGQDEYDKMINLIEEMKEKI